MKSITIRSNDDKLLLKILHRKNGTYDLIQSPDFGKLKIEVRDDKNQKVLFQEIPKRRNING